MFEIVRMAGVSVLAALALQAASPSRSNGGAANPCPPKALAEDPVGAVARTIPGDQTDLATFYRTVGSKAPEIAAACHLKPEFGHLGRLIAARELLGLNRLAETDALAVSALAALDTQQARQLFEPRLIAVRAEVALRRRDTAALPPILAEYDGAVAAGGKALEAASRMEELRACVARNDVWAACANGAITVFFGMYRFVGGDDQNPIVVGHCSQRDVERQLSQADRKRLRPIIKALEAQREACRLDLRIQDVGVRWWLDINRLTPEGALRAQKSAIELDTLLNGLLNQSGAFDGQNPMTQVQISSLKLFIHVTTIRALLYQNFGDHDAMSQEKLMAQAAFSEVPPAITKAQNALLDRDAGYLRLDTFSATAYALAFGDPAEAEVRARILWRLLASNRGFTAREVPPLATVRSQLADDEALLFAVHGPDVSGVLVMADRASQVEFTALDLSAERQRELVKYILDDVSSPPNANSRYHLTAANLLYVQYLCQSEMIQKKRRLLVAGDETMERVPLTIFARPKGPCQRAAVPFETWDDTVPVEDLADIKWAGDQYSVRFMPMMRQQRARATGGVRSGYLGVGAPVSTVRIQREVLPGVTAEQMASRLSEVPGAQTELDASELLFAGADRQKLSGQEAREPRVRQALSERNSLFIHFATHASEADAGLGREPSLSLTPPRSSRLAPDDDGRLTAGEIATFDLTGAVVVLSACRTTAPGPQPGSGIFSGLVASFFEAGAKDVLATYWPIEDEAASAIGPSIMRRLAAGKTGAQAIQEAQSEYRELFKQDPVRRHPYYWAAYVAAQPQPRVAQ